MPEPPDRPEFFDEDDLEGPSVWFFVVLYVLLELAAIGLTVFNWPAGQSTVTGRFWISVLLLPFLIWVALGAGSFTHCEEATNKSGWWNVLRQWRAAHWRHWARSHLLLMDSVTLTPEDPLAERMLGLEGSPPTNPDKTLLLQQTEATRASSRLDSLFEQLLKPLETSIRILARLEKPQVVLQVGDDDCCADLRNAWKRLALPDQLTVTWLAPNAESPLAERWFAEKMPGCRLVIACQLQADESERPCSEVAVALLLSSPSAVAHARLTLKPQACVFRPIVAESDTVNDALAKLLGSEQIPPGKIRHVWFSRLDRRVRNATTFAVREAALNVASQDVDRALGHPGPANAWLLQAMAGQMVQHGQGAQLVASPYRAGVALNLVGISPGPMVWPKEVHVPIFSYSFFISVSVLLLALMVLVYTGMAPWEDGDTFLVVAMIVAALLIVLNTIGSWCSRRHITRQFHARFYE
ncbi:hypothetical protein ACFFJT_10520 [Dyella flava]|uniref:Uncharacterized protein n=1 Tax=Dyella flava TaxID=1920170 RepID=A0ABS2K2T6_9GAMM|nr:hypothetical protein [Dyella flava]MBM7125224.1 hypothetical protein [Dyella flava]GLQ50733.1 hypothetical protein GCM10010872_21820 [Dyella flava]